MKLKRLLFLFAILCGATYAEAQDLTIMVNQKGKVGFADLSGNEVIKCKYESAQPFKDGIAIVETVSPSYTIEGKDGAFGITDVDYLPGENMADFCRRALEKEARQREQMVIEDDVRDDLIFLSSVPWFVTTSVLQEQSTDPDDSFPRVLWDRIHEEHGRKLVNFTVQLNHRLLDGSHVRDLLWRMEELMAPRHDL